MSNHKYVEFPAGVNSVYLDDVCYELERDTDRVTISSEGDFSNYTKNKAPYLVNGSGLKMIINLRKLVKCLYLLPLLLLFLMMFLIDVSWYLWAILILIIMIFLLFDLHLSEIENYYNFSKCNNCGKDYACEEIKKPIIKRVSTYDDYEKMEIRYMRCKYCKREDIKIKSLHKNSKSRKRRNPTKGKACKGCGKKFSLIEYRYPDKYMECDDVYRTIRHYKCTYCGHMEISIKDDEIVID